MPGSTPFSRLPSADPQAGLFERILLAIDRARVRVLKVRMAGMLFGLVACIATTAASWPILREELTESPFIGYLRFIITDSDVVLAHAKDLFFALLDSFPTESAILACAAVFFILGSVGIGQALVRARRGHLTHTHLATH